MQASASAAAAAACIEQTPAKDESEDPTQLASLCRKPTQATAHTVMPHSEGAFGSPLAAPFAETQLVLRPHRTGHATREHPHTGQPKAAARVGVPASSGRNSGPVLKPAPMATSVLTAALGKRLVTSTSRPTGGWFGSSSSNPYATPKPRGATLGSLPLSHAAAKSDTLLATRVTRLRPAAASPFICTPAQTSAGVASLNAAASPKTAAALGMASNAAPLAKQAAANSAGMASSNLASCTKAHTLLQRAGPTASSLPGHAPAPPAAPQASHPAVVMSTTAADGQPVAGSCMLPPQPHKPTQALGPVSAAGAQALLLPDLPVDVRPKSWSARHDLVLVHVQLRLGRRPQAAAAVGRLLKREARAWMRCWMLLGRPAWPPASQGPGLSPWILHAPRSWWRTLSSLRTCAPTLAYTLNNALSTCTHVVSDAWLRCMQQRLLFMCMHATLAASLYCMHAMNVCRGTACEPGTDVHCMVHVACAYQHA